MFSYQFVILISPGSSYKTVCFLCSAQLSFLSLVFSCSQMNGSNLQWDLISQRYLIKLECSYYSRTKMKRMHALVINLQYLHNHSLVSTYHLCLLYDAIWMNYQLVTDEYFFQTYWLIKAKSIRSWATAVVHVWVMPKGLPKFPWIATLLTNFVTLLYTLMIRFHSVFLNSDILNKTNTTQWQ